MTGTRSLIVFDEIQDISRSWPMLTNPPLELWLQRHGA
jgi:hypothetical protein